MHAVSKFDSIFIFTKYFIWQSIDDDDDNNLGRFFAKL